MRYDLDLADYDYDDAVGSRELDRHVDQDRLNEQYQPQLDRCAERIVDKRVVVIVEDRFLIDERSAVEERLIAALAAVVAACGSNGSSASGPSGTPTGPGQTQQGGCIPVSMRINGLGTLTLAFQNQNITTSGLYQFDGLQDATYTVSGQFSNKVTFTVGNPSPTTRHWSSSVKRGLVVVDGPSDGGDTRCGVTFRDPTPASNGGAFQVHIPVLARPNRHVHLGESAVLNAPITMQETI